MDDVLRAERAEPVPEELDEGKVAIIKGMIVRKDRFSDIAAYYKFNQRVITEINTGKYPEYANVQPAPPHQLPPADFPTAYQLLQAQQSLWKVRVALETAEEAVRDALAIIRKAESHGPVHKMGQRR